MRYFFIILCSFYFLSCISTQKSKDYQKYLNDNIEGVSGAYVFLDSTNISLRSDLTYKSLVHRIIKIVDESFIDYFADSEIDYNSKNEKFKILIARTIKPDGRVINIGKKHIVHSKKYYDYPAYDDLMTVKFTYPNAEKGDILELKYFIESKNMYMGGYFDYAKSLAGYYPTKRNEIIISYPKSINLKSRFEKRDVVVNHERIVKGDRVTESFFTLDTSGYEFEPGMSHYFDIGPYVIFSTYKSWQDIADWYAGLSSNVYELNDDLKKLVDKFKKKFPKGGEKLSQEIYSYVTRKVRYVGVWLGSGRVTPRNAVSVYENLYGDCKDKTTLLVALLREAGFKADPVLVSTRQVGKYFNDFPAMIFNHSIVNLELNGKNIYLDPTVKHGAFNYIPDNIQGRYALVPKKNADVFLLPFEAKDSNGSIYDFDLNLDESGGVTGKLVISFFGEAAQTIRSALYGLKNDESKQRVSRVLLSIIPGIKVRRFSFKNMNNFLNPVSLSVDFVSNSYFNKVDDLLVIPSKLTLFKREDLVASKTRKFPLEFWSFWQHKVLFKYHFPANYKIRNSFENLKINNDFFYYELNTIDVKKNEIEIREKFYIKKLIIEPNEFLVFKRDYDEMLLLEKKYLVLQKKK